MELLEGETLGTRMKRRPMLPTELAPIVAGIVAGLAAAHAQAVVHRDLKPDNVFLVPDHASGREGALRVKLLDFGISKVWYGEKLTQTGQILGTPRYMSPEQLGAEVDVDPRIDVYALGVILYEALAGTPPFLASTPTDLIVAILHGKVAPLRTVRPELSPAIEAVVMRAMARHRDARFGTARELADAFLDAAGIDESFRLAPRKGLDTRALGSVRMDDDRSGAIHAQLPPAEEVSISAMKPGTFTELPAFTAPPPPATVMMPMAFDANGLPIAPDRHARQPTELGVSPALPLAATALAPAQALAATGLAPSGLAPSGLAPSGLAPSGLAPSGLAPSGLTLSDSARSPSPTGGLPQVHESHRAIPRTSISELPPVPSVATPVVAAAAPLPPRPHAYDHAAPADTASLPPPSSGRFWWVSILVIGLLAGALTAGAAIALYHWWQPSDEATPPPPPLVVTPDAASSDAAVIPPDASVELPVGRDPSRPDRVVTSGRDREPVDAGVQEDEPDAARTRRTGSGGGGSASNDPTPVEEPMDPLSLATRALRGGDPTGCVDILDDLIAQGATPIALRRRADCLLRLGERTEAIRDYQRFCRLAPDHPAIADVREVLEGLGQTCP
jgi:serine/threonine-protein kinase